MLIIPAIDLQDKRCVQLIGGNFSSEEISISDVNAVVRKFESQGAKRLHIIDLNAAKNRGDNLDSIKDIIKNTSVKTEVGGGIRDIRKAFELIKLGADFIIVGTSAISDMNFLKELSSSIGRDRIIVALDYKDKKILTHGWLKSTQLDPIELGKKLQNYCSQFLLTCVDKEGRLQGPDLDYIKTVKKEIDIPLIVSGGISSLEDIKALHDIGIDGAVIGMALYKDRIDLKQAIEIVK
ncbi:1-(5-phosphoribosyl)-5-[(5-phosphoribosylamino)methylideneamino]imidazole-4-carboxamide isomerase [Candidatus Woesearchaeota archaeon]|nr:1-(5-phosphoribosyl)-5-[(5-phosphoribosylamino)methylideneamino]imidazole-4-carboxamide isomerase [Candidatus Woesearchaeota archaeon]